jgi:hypothetical protein
MIPRQTAWLIRGVTLLAVGAILALGRATLAELLFGAKTLFGVPLNPSDAWIIGAVGIAGILILVAGTIILFFGVGAGIHADQKASTSNTMAIDRTSTILRLACRFAIIFFVLCFLASLIVAALAEVKPEMFGSDFLNDYRAGKEGRFWIKGPQVGLLSRIGLAFGGGLLAMLTMPNGKLADARTPTLWKIRDRTSSFIAILTIGVFSYLSIANNDARTLSPSDFELTRGIRPDRDNPMAINPLGFEKDVLTFTYKGAQKLEEIHLTIEIWLPSGEKPNFQLYQAVWQPGSHKKVEPNLGFGFSKDIQKVILRGDARIESENVRIAVQWDCESTLPKTSE